MSATLEQISFAELLTANEGGTQKWRKWFDEQPAAVLNLPLSIALAKNVREFLVHIFAVELRYAERLKGLPITAYESLPTGSVADLFGIGDRARASKRKIVVHALLHSVRHWAQLATALREAGYPTNWGKDFLYSEVME